MLIRPMPAAAALPVREAVQQVAGPERAARAEVADGRDIVSAIMAGNGE